MEITKEKVISSLLKVNIKTMEDEKYEGAMKLAVEILGVSENEVAEMLYDGVEEDPDKLLWNILKQHYGHKVEIAMYGDKKNPNSITLEDMDTNEVILDAEIYTICARED